MLTEIGFTYLRSAALRLTDDLTKGLDGADGQTLGYDQCGGWHGIQPDRATRRKLRRRSSRATVITHSEKIR